jgi:3-methyladenine DNA glycosylase AlkD
MNVDEAVDALREVADPSRRPGMARVGIDVTNALGVSVPQIRRIAKRAGTDPPLAEALWDTGVHEARMLATLVADPASLTRRQMDEWAADLDSWDVGDFAADLFASTPHRDQTIAAWSARQEPFVKRCAFAMIARRAVSDKDAPDAAFVAYLPLIRTGARDDRNDVKKGVSWALRQIGKRNRALHAAAEAEAQRILDDALVSGSRGARWVARDVLRELRDPATIARLRD